MHIFIGHSGMARKITAGIILVCATLFSFPAYSESLSQPLPEAAATDLKTPETPESVKTVIKSAVKSVVGKRGDFDRINLSYFEDVFVDTAKIAVSPIHWETKDWLTLGLVLGGTSSLFLVDDEVKRFAQKNQSPAASKFSTVGNALGNPLYTLPSVGAFYLYGYLADDSKARRTSLLALESYAISGVLTSGLKMLAKRHRPNSGDSSNTWDGPQFSLNNLSFSSGHTAATFSIATVFADQYQDNPYVAPIAYGLATLTGLSRVYGNEHWSSDVFFGAALGYFISKAVLRYHKMDQDKGGGRLSVVPEISKEMTGLTVKYDF